MAPSWSAPSPSVSARRPAGTIRAGHSRLQVLPLPPGGGGRGVWLRSARLDTGEVVCRSQVCFFLIANEKSSGRNGVQTDLGLQMCAGVCHHVAFVLPPHL